MRDVEIISTAHDVRDARLQRLTSALRAHGLRTGLRAVAETPVVAAAPGEDTRTFPRPGLLRRWLLSLHLPLSAGRAAAVIVTVDPELVPPALLWRSLTRARVVADVHEDYEAVLHDRLWARGVSAWIARSVARMARHAAARADLTTVADDHVPPLRARRRLVVRNLPRPDDLPSPSPPAAKPRALYVGDVRTSRGLRTTVEAVLASPPWELDVIGPVAEQDAGWLRSRLAQAGDDAARMRFHGRLPVAEAWSFAVGAWVGLALFEDTPAFRSALPTKLYEYLGSGLPVLATALPRMRRFLEETETGLLVAGPEEAAATLQRCWQEPGLLEPHRAAARRWREEHLRGPDPYEEFARNVATLLREEGQCERASDAHGGRRRHSKDRRRQRRLAPGADP